MDPVVQWLFDTQALRISPPDSPFWYTSGKIGPFYINTHFLFDGEQSAGMLLEKIDGLLPADTVAEAEALPPITSGDDNALDLPSIDPDEVGPGSVTDPKDEEDGAEKPDEESPEDDGSILPTPTIGGVGLLDDLAKSVNLAFKQPDEAILLIGKTTGWLGQSAYLATVLGREEGAPPPVDLALEKRTGDFVRKLIRSGVVTACHDLSDGGLAVGLAEMAVASGIGATIVDIEDHDPILQYFGEDQGRYLVTLNLDPQGEEITGLWNDAEAAGVFAPWIGTTGGTDLVLGATRPVPVSALQAVHEGWFPNYMDGAAA